MTNVRWRIVLLLFIAGFINYLDRTALAVAAPAVANDLHLSPSRLGLVFSAFFIGYALFNFLGGWAADKWGQKKFFPGPFFYGRYSVARPGWQQDLLLCLR